MPDPVEPREEPKVEAKTAKVVFAEPVQSESVGECFVPPVLTYHLAYKDGKEVCCRVPNGEFSQTTLDELVAKGAPQVKAYLERRLS